MKNKEVEKRFQKIENGLRELLKDTAHKMPHYKIVAIGYLDSSEPYEKGEVSQSFLNKLDLLWNTGAVLSSLGHHECEICTEGGFGTNERAKSGSEKILIDKKNNIKYILPFMLFHYIKIHHFFPDKNFIKFIMETK